jgi:hypothetical protein
MPLKFEKFEQKEEEIIRGRRRNRGVGDPHQLVFDHSQSSFD